jgi:Na+/H+-dicarboxylate symporter
MDKIKKLSIMVLAIIVLSIGLSSTVAASNYWDDNDYGYPEEAMFLGLGLMCIIPIIFLVIGLLIGIWVYKDAEKRGKSGILWLLIVWFVAFPIGFIIWLAVRPPIGGHPNQATGGASAGRTCPSCGRPIPMDASVCPYCGKDFRNP